MKAMSFSPTFLLLLIIALIISDGRSLLATPNRWMQMTSRSYPANEHFKEDKVGRVPSTIGINSPHVQSYNQTESLYDVVHSLSATDQLVVVLVGLPGCGKSTAAHKIASCGRSRWNVACQDVLKSRKKVWDAGLRALEGGDHLIVDRCNFDVEQRDHWIRLSQQVQQEVRLRDENLYDSPPSGSARGTYSNGSNPTCHLKRIVPVSVVLPYSRNVTFCSSRATIRGNDGVHAPDTNWVKVCERMNRQFTMPTTISEAFAAVHVCSTEEDMNKVISLLASI